MSPTPEPTDAESGGAWLESGDGQRWPLGGKCSLGRGAESHVVIDSPKASRKHAVIHVQDEIEFWLIDQVSRNGTYRNEQRVVRPTRLRDGDRLTIGGETFVFRQPAHARRRVDDTPTHFERSTICGDATVLDLRQQHVWLLIADIEKFTVISREWEVDRLALSVGRWFRDSHRIVEKRHGRIPKYLGDGFLACWDDRGGGTTADVVAALGEFQRLQKDSAVDFRVALHYGLVTFGEQSASGEESMLGPEMNFIFRLEDLASMLGVRFCLSTSAQKQVEPLIATTPIPGEHSLKGYANTHRCYTLAGDVTEGA
jgi:adenylate cyclase